jgi:putative ABC transport system permease protein
MMNTLLQDIRYGFRVLLKRPTITLAAVLSLALGIGATTAIFALVDSFLWRPFPVENPSKLVSLFTTDAKNPGFLPISTLNYEDYSDQNKVFEGLAAFGFAAMDLTMNREAERIFGLQVSANYFDTLGVRFTNGRGFLPEEAKSLGSAPVVVLGYGLWQHRFGGSPDILGKTITLNATPFTVIGICPADFDGTIPAFHPAVYVPYTMRNRVNPSLAWFTESRRGVWLNVIGRLKPTVSQPQAQAALQTQARQLEMQYPEANTGRSIALTTLAEARANPLGAAQNPVPKIAALMLAIAGVILLIACANVANLLLARAAGRQKEIAVRQAMGASRVRLARQLLTESLILSLVGGVSGLGISLWVTRLLLALQPTNFFGFSIDASLNARVLLFTLAVCVGASLVFGMAPAMQASRVDFHDTLKEGGRQTGEGTGRGRLRSILVVAEVALAVVALIGAGLFVRSLSNAITMDPGFDSKNILTLNLDVSLQGYTPERGQEFYRQLLERVQGITGVQAATLTTRLPLSFGLQRTTIIEGQVPTENERGVLTNVSTVEVGYFKTLNIPLVKGRVFETYDDAKSTPVAIINETMAKRFWPGQDPLGKRIQFFAGKDGQFTPLIQIVGVAHNSKYVTMGEDPIPFVYLPFQQDYNPGIVMAVKTAGDPSGILPMIRSQVQTLDAGLPIFGVLTMEEQKANSLFLARAGAYLLGAFGLLALVLASVGVYGVISYSVSQRTHEIGLRMALGAQGGDVLRLVVKQGMLLVLAGLAGGAVAAFAMARVIQSLLYGVQPSDPATFAVVSVALLAVAFLASYIPARRAAKVDPMIALRYE